MSGPPTGVESRNAPTRVSSPRSDVLQPMQIGFLHIDVGAPVQDRAVQRRVIIERHIGGDQMRDQIAVPDGTDGGAALVTVHDEARPSPRCGSSGTIALRS